jgi:hypothetical protein
MKQPSAREVERVLGAELLQALRHHAQTSTEWMERLAGQLVNHTLLVWSGAIPPTGVIFWEFGVAAGCVRVVLPEGGRVVVSSAGPAATEPSGLGTWVVGHADAAYASETVPLASRVLSVYGTAGQAVQVQVFTAPVRPDTHGQVAFPEPSP